MSTPAEALALARRCYQAGDLAGAERLCLDVLRADPGQADALIVLGAVRHRGGRLAEAQALYEQALSLRPDHPEAHNHLGIALAQQGRLDEAAGHYRAALRDDPDNADLLNNLGIVLTARGAWDEAAAVLERAVHLRPGHAAARNSLGVALGEARRLDDAVAHLQEAVRLRPDFTDAWSNLAAALTELGRYDEALAACEQALALRPDHVGAHKHRARLWLLLGDLARGWAEYEWRWRTPGSAPSFARPAWDGAPLPGATVLLHAEQGRGDTLQFVRYAPLVRARVGRVVVQAPAGMGPLLARCAGVDEVVERGAALPPFDAHAALLSLPRLLGTTLATVPAAVPYLSADPDLDERWGRELAGFPGLKVGIAWQGSPEYRGDRQRSVRLRQFAPLMGVAGVHFFSMQKGPGSEQVREVAGAWPVTDLGPRLDETAGAFMDTAAVVKHLDLVIAADTAVPHLAGALAVPVWLALPFVPDWRWLLGREDSPWYPTMRLFRQPRLGDWNAVLSRLAEELRRRVNGPGGAGDRPG
jgi:tetratricopeptide (TPR) repeat protein